MSLSIPKEWVEVKLNEVCSKITDGTHKTPNYKENGIRFISIKNIRPFARINWKVYEKYISIEEHKKLIRRCNPEIDDILFPRIGTLGFAKRIDFEEEVSIFVGLGLLKPIRKYINSKYLESYMNTLDIFLLSYNKANGTGRKTLPLAETRNFPFPLCPFNEQTRIVEKIEELFSSLDKAVGVLKKTQEQLVIYRSSVLKAAFEGKLITISEREMFTCQIKDFADVGTGSTPKRGVRKYYENGTIPWVTSSCVNDELVMTSKEKITTAAIKETNCKIFVKGSLLIALYGEGKTRGKTSELGIDAATNQACAVITFQKASKVVKEYLKYYLKKEYEQMRQKASGGVQPNLNLRIIKNLYIYIPKSINKQILIIGEIESRLSVCDKLEETVRQSLKKIEYLRQSILKQAFEGKLVPQDPNDESAEKLLERIKKEKLAVSSKKRKK
ncbi:restriction endonuclease subunit S [bacterium]|nr:restriction endonuclease subunit S [bacterium]